MKSSRTSSTTSSGRADGLSILLTTTIEQDLVPRLFSIRNESEAWFLRRHKRPIQPHRPFHDPFHFSTEVRVSWCVHDIDSSSVIATAVFLARIVIPRSFSRSFESIARSCNSLRSSKVCDCFNNSSTKVVLPWSTWAMMQRYEYLLLILS